MEVHHKGEFIDPAPTFAELKLAKRAEIAAARYESEIGGMDFAGLAIAIDRESVSLIIGAVVQTIFDAKYALQWKTPTGFITLNAEMLQAIETAACQHIQACFDREAEMLKQIEAAASAGELQFITWNGT